MSGTITKFCPTCNADVEAECPRCGETAIYSDALRARAELAEARLARCVAELRCVNYYLRGTSVEFCSDCSPYHYMNEQDAVNCDCVCHGLTALVAEIDREGWTKEKP